MLNQVRHSSPKIGVLSIMRNLSPPMMHLANSTTCWQSLQMMCVSPCSCIVHSTAVRKKMVSARGTVCCPPTGTQPEAMTRSSAKTAQALKANSGGQLPDQIRLRRISVRDQGLGSDSNQPDQRRRIRFQRDGRDGWDGRGGRDSRLATTVGIVYARPRRITV